VFVVATGLAFAGPVRGRFRWAVPSVLRLAELGLVLRLTQVLAPDAAAVAYLLLFVLAFHHYDTLFRVLAGAETPRWVGTAGFGYDGRMLLVAALALAGQLRSGLLVLACWLGLVFVVIATAQWLRTLTAPVREVARV
jgi:hypothetical protein